MKNISLLIAASAISAFLAGSEATAVDSSQVLASEARSTRAASQSIAHDLDAILRLCSNPRFAERLITICRSNDRGKVAMFLQSSIRTKNKIIVDSIDTDFCLRFHFTRRSGLHIDCHLGRCEDED